MLLSPLLTSRRLGEPTDIIELSTDSRGGGLVLGGSSLEYNTEAGPTKFLVGTEQGVVLAINLRNKKQNNGITVSGAGGKRTRRTRRQSMMDL